MNPELTLLLQLECASRMLLETERRLPTINTIALRIKATREIQDAHAKLDKLRGCAFDTETSYEDWRERVQQ